MAIADPFHAALSSWHKADAAHQACLQRARQKWPNDPIHAEDVAHRARWSARDHALEELYATRPTSLRDLSALVTVFCDEDLDTLLDDSIASRGLHTILRAIQRLAMEEALGELCEGITPKSPERQPSAA